MPGIYGNTQLVNVRGLDVPSSNYYCNVRALCEALLVSESDSTTPSQNNSLFAISYNKVPTNSPSAPEEDENWADYWASLGNYAKNFYIDKEMWKDAPSYTRESPEPPPNPPPINTCILSKEWTINGYDGTIWLLSVHSNYIFLQLVAATDNFAPEVILLPHSPQFADANSFPRINTTYSSPGLLYLDVSPNWKWKTSDFNSSHSHLLKYIPEELHQWKNADNDANNSDNILKVVKSKTGTYLDNGNDTLELKVNLPALDQVYGLLCNILFGIGDDRKTDFINTYLAPSNQSRSQKGLLELINDWKERPNDETETFDFSLDAWGDMDITSTVGVYSFDLNNMLIQSLPGIEGDINKIHHLSLTFPSRYLNQDLGKKWYDYVVNHKILLRFDDECWYLDLYLNPEETFTQVEQLIEEVSGYAKLTLTAVF